MIDQKARLSLKLIGKTEGFSILEYQYTNAQSYQFLMGSLDRRSTSCVRIRNLQETWCYNYSKNYRYRLPVAKRLPLILRLLLRLPFLVFFLYMFNWYVRNCRSGRHLMSRYRCSFHQADIMYEYPATSTRYQVLGPMIFLLVVIGITNITIHR